MRPPRPAPPRARPLAPALLLALAVPYACAPPAEPASGPGLLRVVATTGMIADAAARVGGERAAVEALMGPGVDPHLYRASAGDVERLARADLILYHGLHLEAAMSEVLAAMGGRRRTAAVAAGIAPERLLAPPEFKGATDPHIWLDVGLWRQAVAAVTEALAAADPPGAATVRANAAAYLAELADLDAWVRRRLAALPAERRILITAHDAFNYFGRAYGLEVRGLQGISTAAEAGAADVQRLVDLVVARRIPAIFVETSVAPRTIEAVQAAVAARGRAVAIGGALFSDAMGSRGTPEGTYTGMIRHNVETIAAALSQPAPALAEAP